MNRETLKNYLNGKYQGSQSFMKNVIFPIFGESAFENSYNTNLLVNQPELNTLAESTGIKSVEQVGLMDIGIERLYIFDITVKDRVMMERNRVNIQRLVRRTLDSFSCAFMIFHYEDDSRWDWRFTFYRKGGTNQEVTDGKRYTFLLGPNQSCRTAAENFMRLYDKQGNLEIEDIEKAFDVEALSKEFFEKYKSHYSRFVNYISDPANGMRDSFILTGFDHTGLSEKQITDKEEKSIRDYVKKLLGRIVFLHFLQKKGWMGVPEKGEWGEGDMQFMRNLFLCSTERQKDDFLDLVLEPIFEALDTDRGKNNDLFDTKVALPCGNVVKIPYLNGGLFERDYIDEIDTKFPKEMFAELFEFFYQYNFTIDENDPDDAQVGVDPEMLGRIFENLLEDNKDKGAFYTPKEIVQYMCRESLISYLQTNFGDEQKEAIRQFVIGHDKTSIEGIENQIDALLRDVKICDPAIGSGAFPMGLLRELFFCRSAIEPNIVDNAASIKRHIIQNNIYGVDIEKGAVDIARLRFWLALIVDEKSPDTLPNLDFKIMQGNSLLESYRGADLTTITEKKNSENDQLTFFDDMVDVYRMELRKKIAEYYDTADHSRRSQLRKEIAENVKNQLSEQRIEVDFGDIDLSANEHFFLWHTWFHDVFSRPSKEGFDIVIGNPPYVEAKKLKGISNKLKPLYKVYSGTADLSVYFAELSLILLAEGGVSSFITTNKFFTTRYGKKVRELYVSNTIKKIIDFEQVEVFEDILVSSVIIETKKEQAPDNNSFTYEKFYKLSKEEFRREFIVRLGALGCYCQDNISSEEWSFADNTSLSLKRKIENNSTCLSELIGVNIYRGVTTGFNPAFIVDNQIKELLIEKDVNNAKIIKNMLQGRNIRKWYYNESDEFLIQTGFDIDIPYNYPNIYTHLKLYEKDLISRSDQGKNWWNLRACKYYDEFEVPEKIIWGLTADKWAFAIDKNKHYLPSNAYMLTSNNIDVMYILGVLNSKLLHYYFKFIGVMTAGGAYTLKAATISSMPFKVADNTSEIADIVKKILNIKESNHDADVGYIEAELDAMVYRLYNLSENEIKLIERNL